MKRWQLVVVILLLIGVAAWAADRHARSVWQERADIAQHAVDSLKGLERAKDTVYTHRVDTLRQWHTHWDSILVAGRTDTMTIWRVITVADSTIKACEAVVQTCEERVALARERADSAEAVAKDYKRLARGPFIRPALELTVAPSTWKPQAAAEVTLGRGAFKLLGRLDAGEGSSTCQYVSAQEATVCSTSFTTTARVGLRWSF